MKRALFIGGPILVISACVIVLFNMQGSGGSSEPSTPAVVAKAPAVYKPPAPEPAKEEKNDGVFVGRVESFTFANEYVERPDAPKPEIKN